MSEAVAATLEESMPPLKHVPIGTSALNLYLIERLNSFSYSSIAEFSLKYSSLSGKS